MTSLLFGSGGPPPTTAAASAAAAPVVAMDGAAGAAVPWAVLLALAAAAVALLSAAGSCLAAAIAAGAAAARRSSRATVDPAAAAAAGGKRGKAVAGPGDGGWLPTWLWQRPGNGSGNSGSASAAAKSAFVVDAHASSPCSFSPPPPPSDTAAAALGAAALEAAALEVQGAAGAGAGAGALASHPLPLDLSDDDEWASPSSVADAAGGNVPGLREQQTAGAAAAAAASPRKAPGSKRPAAPTAPRAASGWRRAAARAVKALDDAAAHLASLPRTLRTLAWAARAGWAYKRFLSSSDPLADPAAHQRGLSALHDLYAERLTEVCRANGGVYVKAGQFAGAFNAVPPEYRKRLALLQDKAKARPFWTVDRVLRCELGAGAERVFAEFSAEATAAASLAQVHKARLQSGAQVAVKVQYPGLRGAADADLTALSLLSAAAVAAFPGFSLGWLYAELRHKLEEELDFSIEVAHSRRLMARLSRHHGVAVPRLYPELCTPKVLVMEWVDGAKVNDLRALRAARISPRAVAGRLEAAFAEMTFLHGYLHADPHPGNIMVRPTRRPSLASYVATGSVRPFEIVLLDHGCYLTLEERTRRLYCRLWASLFAGDRAAAAAAAIALGGQRAGQILPVVLFQRARTKQEREDMQRAAGVGGFGDISALLTTAPREVVELLRITAVVRSVTGPLGAPRAERLRLNCSYALAGLRRRPQHHHRHGEEAGEAAGGAAADAAAADAGDAGDADGGGSCGSVAGDGGSVAGGSTSTATGAAASAAAASSSSDGLAGSSGGGGSGGEGELASRVKTEARLALVTGYVVASTVCGRALRATLAVFGQNVPLA